jgi:hypothetical protein
VSGYECGAITEHQRHMADLFSTCRALGRLEFLVDVDNRPSDERLVQLATIVADLRRDLGLSENPLTTIKTATTDGSEL